MIKIPSIHAVAHAVLLTVIITFSAQADPFSKARLIENTGLQLPETILHDKNKDLYVISNVNAHPVAKDDNGFISLMNPDGTIKMLKWIDGADEKITLHAPKGMTIHKDRLYVADVDTIRIFDNNTGKPLDEIQIKGTTFLNDVAVASDGTIYVSESAVVFKEGKFSGTGKDAIYSISKDKKITRLVSGKELGQPNGLEILADNTLATVTRGDDRLYTLNSEGKILSTTRAPGKMLDGLIHLPNGDYLVTSWQKVSIYRISRQSASLETKLPTPAANIGYDAKRNRLLIPFLLKNNIAFMELK